MNKIVASVGLAALSASSMQAIGQELNTGNSRWWSVSAALRGFYDDNINTTHVNKVESFGFSISPGVNVNWSDGPTKVMAGYLFTLNYFDKTPSGNSDNVDMSHMFNALVNHSFNERYQLAVTDSFTIGQEPDSLRTVPNAPLSTVQRIPGNNVRNYGAIILSAQMTPLFGLEVGYGNVYVNYDGQFDPTLNPPLTPVTASPSGALDRVEHLAHIDGRWTVQPTTVALLGYMFDLVDYTGDEPINGLNLNPNANPPAVLNPFFSDQRNSRSHIVYVGVEHAFQPNLKGSLRAGGQFVDYFNDPSSESTISPYITANLSYTYAPESHLDVGFTQRRSPTDITGSSAADRVLDSDVSLVYGSIYHRILPHLYGSVIGTFQNSSFNGGSMDGDSEQYYQLGINVQYRINTCLSTEIGYNYDRNESDNPARQYDRNRVYIGVAASY